MELVVAPQDDLGIVGNDCVLARLIEKQHVGARNARARFQRAARLVRVAELIPVAIDFHRDSVTGRSDGPEVLAAFQMDVLLIADGGQFFEAVFTTAGCTIVDAENVIERDMSALFDRAARLFHMLEVHQGVIDMDRNGLSMHLLLLPAECRVRKHAVEGSEYQ